MHAKHRATRRVFSGTLPEDVLTGSARITLSGKSAALIEGQEGVVEMNPGRIRLKSRSGVISICGKNLKLKELSIDAAIVTAEEILSVSYGSG